MFVITFIGSNALIDLHTGPDKFQSIKYIKKLD